MKLPSLYDNTLWFISTIKSNRHTILAIHRIPGFSFCIQLRKSNTLGTYNGCTVNHGLTSICYRAVAVHLFMCNMQRIPVCYQERVLVCNMRIQFTWNVSDVELGIMSCCGSFFRQVKLVCRENTPSCITFTACVFWAAKKYNCSYCY